MFDEIDAKFHVAGKDVLFCWGETIYSPVARSIHPSIIAHERVHMLQQGIVEEEIRTWWRMYIADDLFRLACEIPAHKAEYEWYAEAPRPERRHALTFIAKKLAAPLYGNLISLEMARRVISGKVEIPSTIQNRADAAMKPVTASATAGRD